MLTRDEENIIQIKVAYARMLKRTFEVEVRGIVLPVTPHSTLNTLRDTWAYLAVRRARMAAEEAGMI